LKSSSIMIILVLSLALLSWGCSRTGSGDENALYRNINEAVKQGDFEAVKTFIARNPKIVDSKDKRGWTPLHYAAATGNKEITELLISSGADIKAQNNDGRSPLYSAVLSGQKRVIQFLISKGADVNETDKKGHTMLSRAQSSKRGDIAQILIQNGAKE
jgi:ankyrin repeat protein